MTMYLGRNNILAPHKLTTANHNHRTLMCRGPIHLSRPTSSLRRTTAAHSISKSEPALLPYTVRPNDTLWEVAVKHGVSMAAIKEANNMHQRDPQLALGQTILVPVNHSLDNVYGSNGQESPLKQPTKPSERIQNDMGSVADAILQTSPYEKQKPEARGCNSAAFIKLRSDFPDLWDYAGTAVKEITVEDAENLYLASFNLELQKDTLLIVYAPWCPYCQEMEHEVERLARGLQHDQSITIAKLRGDLPGVRYFARDLLTVKNFPAILVFSRNSKNFFKYTGASRDTQSVLRFMNHVCKRTGPDALQLAATEALAAPVLAVTTGASPAVFNDENWSAKSMWFAGAVALAAAVLTASAWGAFQKPSAEAAIVQLRETDGASVDKSMRKLWNLLVQLAKLRLAIVLGMASTAEPGTIVPAMQGGSDASATPDTHVTSNASASTNLAAPTAAVLPMAAASVPSTVTDGAGDSEGLEHTQAIEQPVASITAATSTHADGSIPSADARTDAAADELSHINNCDPQELLRIMHEEGGNFDRIMSRVMQGDGVKIVPNNAQQTQS